MASSTQIVNMALLKVGHGPLISLDLDESEVAVTARVVYDLCLDDMLAAHPWNFANQRVSLPQLTYTQVGDAWTYAYQLPNDCLRVHSVEPLGAQFEINGRVLLCNLAPPVVVTYMRRESDTTMFTPLFSMALVYRLAMEFSTTLSARDTHTSNFTQQYFGKLQEAKAADGQEEGPRYEDDNPLAAQRRWHDEEGTF